MKTQNTLTSPTMNSWVFLVVAALSSKDVFCSHYHGPTALPQVLHNGYLADSHDVAAAKSSHLAILSHQSHGYVNTHNSHDSEHSYNGDLRYHGPTAVPHVLHDGHIADTHEVAAAKAEHFALVNQAKTHVGHVYNNGGSSYGFAHQPSYHGHVANPVVLKSGYLADTHEVAAAKQHHLQALHSRHSGQRGHSY